MILIGRAWSAGEDDQLRLRLKQRESVRAFWRSHFEVWAISGLTQRDYCERHGLNLKSFGNSRAQLKREHAIGAASAPARYPQLRSSNEPLASHMANPTAKEKTLMVSPLAAATERYPSFSEDAKPRIVAEASCAGSSLSAVAPPIEVKHFGRFCQFDVRYRLHVRAPLADFARSASHHGMDV